MNRTTALLVLLPAAAVAVAAPVPKAKPVIDVRDSDGTVLLAAADLTSYDWATHSLTLKDGTKGPFLKALGEAVRFAVCVDGKPVMNGVAIPLSPTSAHYEPVIELGDATTGASGEERVVISKGFGGPKAHAETRDVKELKAALEKAGKLKADK